MARSTGSTTRIDCASGVVDLSGGFSAVGVAYRTGGTQLLSVLEADTNPVADFRVASGQMNAFIGSFRPPSVAVNITASAWYLLAWSKQPGTTVMRYHAYDMAAGTWTRSDSATFASPTATAGMVRLGNGSGASPSTGWNGAVAACALWNRGLSDAELDRLPYSLAAWLAAGPSAMWVLDQHSTATPVLDLTGGGGNQTAISGTSVSTLSVPVLSYGHPIILATRDSGAGGGTTATATAATAIGTAYGATPTIQATASQAAGTGTTGTPAAAVTTPAALAAATATAYDAAAATGSATIAQAQPATAIGAAHTPAPAIRATTTDAAGIGVAHTPAPALAAAATTATATGVTHQPTPALAPTASPATATGTTNPPGSTITAGAAAATAVGAAYPGSVPTGERRNLTLHAGPPSAKWRTRPPAGKWRAGPPIQ